MAAHTQKLVTFNFEKSKVRTVVVNQEPWFVAEDVCKALKLSNPTMSLKSLDDDERSKFNLGRQGHANVISESGMYTLVLRCRDAVKPGTVPHRFRKWVTGKVLPSIRKTGHYSKPETTVTLDYAEAYNLAGLFQLIDMFKEDIKRAEKMLRVVNSPYAPAMYDAWHEPACFMAGLRGVQQRCNAVRSKVRCLEM